MSNQELQHIVHTGPASKYREPVVPTEYDIRRQAIRDEAEAARHACHGSGATAAKELIGVREATALWYIGASETLGKSILHAREILDRAQEQRTRQALGQVGLLDLQG